jgi:hypothetical protein
LSDQFPGDWQSVAPAGVAIGRSADAPYDLSYNLQDGAIAAHTSWHGAAADAEYAHAHFTGLAGGVEDLVDPLRQISDQFASTAHGVWSSYEAATGFVKGMLDAAIIAGISAAPARSPPRPSSAPSSATASPRSKSAECSTCGPKPPGR